MNLNLNKKKLSHSIIENEITLLDYQVIQTCWKINLESEKKNDNQKNTIFQDLLKKKVNPINNLQQKNVLKKLSKITFIANFKNNMQNKPLKQLENVKISNQIIGATKIFSFKNNLQIIEFLKKSTKSNLTNFWFVQLKQFFLKMPKDDINLWFIKKTDIYNTINITNLTNFNLFNINIKLQKNKS